MSGQIYETFRQVVMVEARAEFAHIALASLARIRVSVLIICGDEDVYFPKEYLIEMAGLIKESILKLY